MFAIMRYSLGVNKALHDAVERNALSASVRSEMTQIAGAGFNGTYGRDLIKSGAAKCRHSAAAMVFARLAVAAERTPGGPIRAADWRAAATQAIINAGAAEKDGPKVVAEMMRTHQR